MTTGLGFLVMDRPQFDLSSNMLAARQSTIYAKTIDPKALDSLPVGCG
jgi:hypothetical protein